MKYLGAKTRVKFNGSCWKQEKIIYTHREIVNIYIVYKIDKNDNTSSDPKLEKCLFDSVSLTKNYDIGKYQYSGYGTGFDKHGFLPHPSGETGRNVIIFGVEMSYSTKIDNRKKDIFILGKSPTQGLEHTISTEKNLFSWFYWK